MTLDDYLRAQKPRGMREADFAEKIGVTQPHVNKLRRGAIAPSWPLILRIKTATGNKVKPTDWEKAHTQPVPETAA